MQKFTVKRFFEIFLEDNKIPFTREFRIKDAIIDYKLDFGGKVNLAEAKSDRSDIFSAVGQLVNAKRTCSHVFLIAPPVFIKKITKIDEEINVLSDIGLIEVSGGKVNILRKPTADYYFKEYKILKRRREHPRKNGMYVNKTDIDILNNFEKKEFFIADVSKKYGKSMPYTRHIINRLRRAKLIGETNEGNLPKTFKVIKKDVKLDEWIDFKHSLNQQN